MLSFKLIDFKKGYSSEFIKNKNKPVYRMGKAFTDIDLKNNSQLLFMVLDLEEELRANIKAVNKYINDLRREAQGLNGEALRELKIKSLAVHKGLQYHYKLFDAQADGYSVKFGYDSPYLYTLVRVFGERLQALEQLFDGADAVVNRG